MFEPSFLWIIMFIRTASPFVGTGSTDHQNVTNMDVLQLFAANEIMADDNNCDIALMVKTVKTVVSLMQWKSIIIMHDGTKDIVLHGILDSLWNHDVYTCILDIRVFRETSVPVYCPNQESEVNFITVCNEDNLQIPINIFSHNDDKLKFLLMLSVDITSTSQYPLFKDSIMDNVAILRPYRPNDEKDICFNGFDLSTLMYLNKGHRSFETRMIITNQDFNLSRNLIYPNLDFGLNQKKLVISALKSQPFCVLNNETGNREMTGLYGEILNQLVKDLNFTYEIVRPEDGEWGRIDDNGSWTGLVRQLENKEVDMVLAPLAVSIERSRVIDYGTTIFYDHSSFLMRSDTGGIRWDTVIKPFQVPTFLVLFAIFMGSSFSLFIVEKCTKFYDGRGQSMLPTFGACLWYFFGASLAQGGTYETRSHGGALFISTFWIYSVIVLVIYSGSLMSQLTVMKEEQMVETAKDLASQSKYTYGTLGGSYYSMTLKNSSRPIYKVLYNNIMKFYRSDPDVLSTDHEVHYRKIKTENYVLILDKVYMDMKAATDCDLHVSSASFDVVQEAPGFPKGSPFRDIISKKILSYHDNGLIDLWVSKSMPVNECDDFQKVQAKSLSMDDFISAFVALVIGFVAASVIFIIEKCCKCCAKVENM